MGDSEKCTVNIWGNKKEIKSGMMGYMGGKRNSEVMHNRVEESNAICTFNRCLNRRSMKGW